MPHLVEERMKDCIVLPGLQGLLAADPASLGGLVWVQVGLDGSRGCLGNRGSCCKVAEIRVQGPGFEFRGLGLGFFLIFQVLQNLRVSGPWDSG